MHYLTIRNSVNGYLRRLEGQLSVPPNFTNSAKIFHIIKDFNLNVKTLINFISEIIAAQGTAH